MRAFPIPSRSAEHGQILVLVALAITALLAATALVIDGGNAYAQQRWTQNGVDATAEAGATQLARRLSGVAITDADVQTAIDAAASDNEITAVDSAEYTDRVGTVLGPVGGGIPANTQGVKVGGSRDFGTYLAGVVGIDNWKASATATAITGYAEESGFGNVIPLTFPILLTQCETGGGSSKIYFPDDGITQPPDNPPFGTSWPFGPNNLVAIPLCSNGPGNVGWIDWSGGGGGAAEIERYIRGELLNPPITTPRWYEVTETGGKTALDAPMDIWEGKDITIPIFHAEADDPGTAFNEELIGTCDAAPGGTRTLLSDCAAGDIGANGNGWYFLTTFAVFHLEHAYIQENHQAECNAAYPTLVSPASPADATNPENNCLIGYFKDRVVATNMTVGSSTPTSQFQPLAIQLIQ
jgi:hypothetical protein